MQDRKRITDIRLERMQDQFSLFGGKESNALDRACKRKEKEIYKRKCFTISDI